MSANNVEAAAYTLLANKLRVSTQTLWYAMLLDNLRGIHIHTYT